jgi:hypothetical protein
LGTLSIDASLRHEFDRRWRRFADEKAALTKKQWGLSIIVDPVMQGPNPDGRIVYYNVDSAFMNALRADNFGEEV